MKPHPHVTEIDDTTFDQEVLASDLPVLVEFGATWCPPCRALEPIVARIAAEHAGRVKVVVMDSDASPVTAQRYGVRGVPTVLVFHRGEKTGAQLGLTTRERLLQLLPAG